METEKKVAEPAAPQPNPPENLTPEQLDKVVGGTGVQQGIELNHNQNLV